MPYKHIPIKSITNDVLMDIFFVEMNFYSYQNNGGYPLKNENQKGQNNIVPTALKLQILYLYAIHISSRWDCNAVGMLCL